MEPTQGEQPTIDQNSLSCRVCHQDILPQFYFCPNCGTKIAEPPLLTTFSSQLGLYLFSAILPLICFLFVTKWKGFSYIRSQDAKARTVGFIAFTTLVLSTILTSWYAYTYTQKITQSLLKSQTSGVNLDDF